MTNRNATSIFVGFEAALSGLHDGYIVKDNLRGGFFNFGKESRPEYLDDENIDQVVARFLLPEFTWWNEKRAYQAYQDLRSAVLEAEKDGRAAWLQEDEQACWQSLGGMQKRHRQGVIVRPSVNVNHSRNYGARQIAEAAADQGLAYRVFGYLEERVHVEPTWLAEILPD